MRAPLNPPVTTWDGRVVWLVGASTGIGRALAGELAARCARVVVSARSVEPLAEFSRAHPGSIALAMDVTEADAASRAMREIVQRHGGIDHVVYCAGHYRPQRASALDLRELLRHVDVNYVGALRVLDAVLPTLLAQRRGHVSLVASVAGYRGLPKGLAYGPTKAALINLAETLYLDLRGHGIGVSVVNPGFVRTPMTAANDFEMPALIDPDEAARAIVDGWRRGAFEMHFPKRFTGWLKLMRLLPYRVYFRAVAKATRL